MKLVKTSLRVLMITEISVLAGLAVVLTAVLWVNRNDR